MAAHGLDGVDRAVLGELLADSSAPVPAVSKRVGASSSAIYARIRRMRESGVIRRFTVDVDERALGYGAAALVGLRAEPGRAADVAGALLAVPSVGYVAEVAGRFDVVARVRAGDVEGLREAVSGGVGSVGGVASAEAMVEMRGHYRAPPPPARA